MQFVPDEVLNKIILKKILKKKKIGLTYQSTRAGTQRMEVSIVYFSTSIINSPSILSGFRSKKDKQPESPSKHLILSIDGFPVKR